MGIEPGTYRAVLRLRGNELFNEIKHIIVVQENGEVVEPFFVANQHSTHEQVHTFNPPRRWDPKLLGDYSLRQINHADLAYYKGETQ